MRPEALAALHARCFTDAPRPWSETEFGDMLKAQGIQLIAAEGGEGFLLLRVAGPEVEVLTLCTEPDCRRRGIARSLLIRAEDRARAAGAERIFLEVAETNAPARALYRALDYREAGIRKDYYAARGRRAISAIVLGKAISPKPSAAAPQNSH